MVSNYLLHQQNVNRVYIVHLLNNKAQKTIGYASNLQSLWRIYALQTDKRKNNQQRRLDERKLECRGRLKMCVSLWNIGGFRPWCLFGAVLDPQFCNAQYLCTHRVHIRVFAVQHLDHLKLANYQLRKQQFNINDPLKSKYQNSHFTWFGRAKPLGRAWCD